jgi:hypothetical protein
MFKNLRNQFFDRLGKSPGTICEGDPIHVDEKRLSEKTLIEKLRSCGCYLDKSSLAKLGEKAMSMQEIKDAIIKACDQGAWGNHTTGWVEICVSELWRRWFPDKILFESLGQRVQSINELVDADNQLAAARVWFKTWPLFIELLDRCDVKSEADFRKRYSTCKEMLTWMFELPIALKSEDLDEDPFIANRISYCCAVLKRLSPDNQAGKTVNEIRRVLALSHAKLREYDHVDNLYSTWIKAEPAYTAAWSEWASIYIRDEKNESRFERAASILRQGIQGCKNRINVAPKRAEADRISLLVQLYNVICDEQNQIFSELGIHVYDVGDECSHKHLQN